MYDDAYAAELYEEGKREIVNEYLARRFTESAAQEIFDFLPIRYINPTDEEYFLNLINIHNHCYAVHNFHFALIALHMIYMGIVYHYLYQVLRCKPKEFERVIIGFHDQIKKEKCENIAWQDFSLINESTIFEFYRTVGLTKEEIASLKKPVQKRNGLAHTNGILLSEQSEYEYRISEILECLEKVNSACAKCHRKLFKEFLKSIKIGVKDKGEANLLLVNDYLMFNGTNKKALLGLLDENINDRNLKIIKKALVELVI
jgi:hypothetical protein